VSKLDTIYWVLGLIANVLSIIGFVITLMLFRKVKKIQNEYFRAARVPELLEQLVANKHSLQALVAASREADARPDDTFIKPPIRDSINATLEICKSNLLNASYKFDGYLNQEIASLIRVISEVNKIKITYVEIGKVQSRLNGLIAGIENDLKDKKWIKGN
jgi:ABC-type multidrug transport system fused ATPase/permease subunit